jgi:hypothetical protein
MDDVRIGPDHFDRRPFQPMPQIIQDPDRHSAVHDLRREFRGESSRWPVFPRARKHRHVVAGAKVLMRVRPHKMVYVLTDAGPLTQRRTVVNENAHGSTSTLTFEV